MVNEILNAGRELAFNHLRKTNRMLLVHDKSDAFFHNFNEKYKVCNVLLIGSDYADIPWTAGYSVTNLATTLRMAYEDESLNSEVDVLYIDMTSQLVLGNYLDKCVTDNTMLIIKIKSPEEIESIPASLKQRDASMFKFGNWGLPHNQNSQYYIVLL